MNTPTVITGSFGGFVFTEAGKRRMLLRDGDGQEHLLKVPRILRRRIIGKFRVGESIRVAVADEHDPESGSSKRVVMQVLPEAGSFGASSLPPPFHESAPACVVRVCSKKNCWRNGGQELFAALSQEAAAVGQSARIEIRQVGCLDRCKQVPNVDAGHRTFSRCSPHHARSIIAQAMGQTLTVNLPGKD